MITSVCNLCSFANLRPHSYVSFQKIISLQIFYKGKSPTKSYKANTFNQLPILYHLSWPAGLQVVSFQSFVVFTNHIKQNSYLQTFFCIC